jgi:hypothetical protein
VVDPDQEDGGEVYRFHLSDEVRGCTLTRTHAAVSEQAPDPATSLDTYSPVPMCRTHSACLDVEEDAEFIVLIS